MLRQRNEQIQMMARLLDLLIGVLAFFLAYSMRDKVAQGWGGLQAEPLAPLSSMSWILACSLSLRLLLYPFFGFYESLRLKTIAEIVLMVGRALVCEFLILSTFVFLFQAKNTSRALLGLYLAISYGGVLFSKLGIRVLLSAIRRRGYNIRQVLVVGTGRHAEKVIVSLGRVKHWGYLPCGVLSVASEMTAAETVAGIPVLGRLDQLERIVNSQTVDDVFFALDFLDPREIERAIIVCEELGIPARISLGLFDLPHSRVTFLNLDHVPIVTFYRNLMTPLDAFLKRTVDIVGAMVGLVLTGALWPWIVYRIRRESPGPVIFKQVRIGENGRRFKCYKFRTMGIDAEERKHELLAGNLMNGPMFKIQQDPRVFPFGAFLRRTSLDELPQFFNILRGDMSLVGTRPPTPDEVVRYELHYRRRLSVRPGLTGLWQVSGRNQITDFNEVLELDLEYIDRWSIWLDFKIIFRTVWMVAGRRGAY